MKTSFSHFVFAVSVLSSSLAVAQTELGTVKFFNPYTRGGAGLGFITPQGGTSDVAFENSTVLPQDRPHLQHGCLVAFERNPRQTKLVSALRLIRCPPF